jgi:hypothetical protein
VHGAAPSSTYVSAAPAGGFVVWRLRIAVQR